MVGQLQVFVMYTGLTPAHQALWMWTWCCQIWTDVGISPRNVWNASIHRGHSGLAQWFTRALKWWRLTERSTTEEDWWEASTAAAVTGLVARREEVLTASATRCYGNTTRPQREKGTQEYLDKWPGVRDMDGELQLQLQEDGDSSTRHRLMESSGLWLTLQWKW